MSYQIGAYDQEPNDPTVIVVVRGQHDVSRLINLFAGGVNTVEQIQAGREMRAKVKRHNGGRAAMELLAQHGGPDFLADQDQCAWHYLRRFTGPGLLGPETSIDQYDLQHPGQCALLPAGAVCWATYEPFRHWWPTEHGDYRIRPEEFENGGDEDGPNIEVTLRIQVRADNGAWRDYDGDTAGAEPKTATA